jgi:hypothetical protein
MKCGGVDSNKPAKKTLAMIAPRVGHTYWSKISLTDNGIANQQQQRLVSSLSQKHRAVVTLIFVLASKFSFYCMTYCILVASASLT